jgi:hypothetical protein
MAKAGKSVGQKYGKSTANVTRSRNVRPNTKRTYLSKLCDELEGAAAGLFYISEQDHPYSFFTLLQRDLLRDGDKLTALEFLSGVGLSQELTDEYKIPVDQLIEERTADNFFPSIDDLTG